MSKSHVYVIAWSGRGPTKIGVAQNPISRLNTLQGACPYRLRIYRAVVMPNSDMAFALEFKCLTELKDVRMIGEWVRLGPAAVAALVHEEALKINSHAAKWQPTKAELQRRQTRLGEIVAPGRRDREPPSAERIRDAIDEARQLGIRIIK